MTFKARCRQLATVLVYLPMASAAFLAVASIVAIVAAAGAAGRGRRWVRQRLGGAESPTVGASVT
jgi:cobalamin synthase